jgi:hypothetical protein
MGNGSGINGEGKGEPEIDFGHFFRSTAAVAVDRKNIQIPGLRGPRRPRGSFSNSDLAQTAFEVGLQVFQCLKTDCNA